MPLVDIDLLDAPAAAPDPTIPPDSPSLAYWRTGLKLWKRRDGKGGLTTRFLDVQAAVRALLDAGSPLGELASEQFEYANTVTRGQLTAPIDALGTRFHAVFGFTAEEADESLWRAYRVSVGDLEGVWPLGSEPVTADPSEVPTDA